MTQAFNLSQLANNLNTSGQLDATDGLTGAVPVANGGTGLTSVGTSGNVLTSNGSVWTSTAIPAPTIADGSITDPKIADGLVAGSNSLSIGDVQYNAVPPNNSLILRATAYIFRGGVMNFTCVVYNGNIGNENTSTIGAQIRRNGVNLSSVLSVSTPTNSSRTLTFSNITVPSGGNIQFYISNSSSNSNIATFTSINYSVGNTLKLIPFSSPTLYA